MYKKTYLLLGKEFNYEDHRLVQRKRKRKQDSILFLSPNIQLTFTIMHHSSLILEKKKTIYNPWYDSYHSLYTCTFYHTTLSKLFCSFMIFEIEVWYTHSTDLAIKCLPSSKKCIYTRKMHVYILVCNWFTWFLPWIVIYQNMFKYIFSNHSESTSKLNLMDKGLQ